MWRTNSSDLAPAVELSVVDKSMLSGGHGPAVAEAMKLVVAMAGWSRATQLIDVTGAHIDACLFHGQAGLDYAERLAETGAQVRVPTTLNVSSLDLLHPETFRGSSARQSSAKRLMDAYVKLGCRPTWTCAPYQLPDRPAFGEHVAWAESNAIAFANSVLGARTGRYGDFFDIAAALTGRVPLASFHLAENRYARVIFDVVEVAPHLLQSEIVYPLLGYLVGKLAASRVPAVIGLPTGLAEDKLKAFGAAAAASGAVGMFHIVGSTPEAPTLDDALGTAEPEACIKVTSSDLLRIRSEIGCEGTPRPLVGVSLGTPHFSLNEFEELTELIDGTRVHPSIEFTVNTSRHVLADLQQRGWDSILSHSGVRIITDTCSYVTPVLKNLDGTILTNSAKWAHYAPSHLGVDVAFGTLRECVDSARSGALQYDSEFWGDHG